MANIILLYLPLGFQFSMGGNECFDANSPLNFESNLDLNA